MHLQNDQPLINQNDHLHDFPASAMLSLLSARNRHYHSLYDQLANLDVDATHSPASDERFILDDADSVLAHGHFHHHQPHGLDEHQQDITDHHHLEHHPELLQLEQDIHSPHSNLIRFAPVPEDEHMFQHVGQVPYYEHGLQDQHEQQEFVEQDQPSNAGGNGGNHNGGSASLTTMETMEPAAKPILMLDSDQWSASDENHFYTPFKVNAMNVYSRYLLQDDHDQHDEQDSDYEHDFDDKCSSKASQALTSEDVEDAVNDGVAAMRSYARTIQQDAEQTNRREPFIPAGVLDSKIFELTTLNLKRDKCLSKLDVITILPKINPKKISNHYEMTACQLEDKIICEPKAKFRSIDGSCNNLK